MFSKMFGGRARATPGAVLEALAEFERQVSHECGLTLNRSKTEWHAASAATGDRVRKDMERAGLKRGVDGNGGYGIEVVGVPVGCRDFVAHFVHCKSERALSKSNTILRKLCPNHVQVAQAIGADGRDDCRAGPRGVFTCVTLQ